MRSLARTLALTAAMLAAVTWTVMYGQSGGWPGTLDPSFGTGGVAMSTSPSGYPDKIATQLVGVEEMIVAVSGGSWTMTRHRSNGALDSTFGSLWRASTPLEGGPR